MIIKLKLRPSNFLRFTHHIPEDVRKLVEFTGAILAGGSLRSAIDKSAVCDFDLFVNSNEQFEQAKTTLKAYGYKLVKECPNKELLTMVLGAVKIQIVNSVDFTDPIGVLDRFDLVPCMFAWDGKDQLYCDHEAIVCAKRKRLKVRNITYPIGTIGRIRKYELKGYKSSPKMWRTLIELTHEALKKQNVLLDNEAFWRTYID